MTNDLTISELQTQIDSWIKSVGVRYFSELTNLGILTEEVGELARLMVRKYGDQSFKSENEECNIEDEIADILWVLVCIANQTGVNLSDAIQRNIDKKTLRDKDRHINNPKLKEKQ
ncbi:MAG: nucleotide pyrophosphohydrolase [Ginsengibacter sp.]